MQIGTTFDIDQAESLKLNWEKTLERIITLGLSPIRIGIKWSRVEKEENQLDWSDYDAIFKHLEEKRIETILAIGLKVPRWPEFFIPKWLNASEKMLYKFSLKDEVLVNRLFDFEKCVLDRYGKYKNISYIQVENEPFILAGDYKRRIARNLLEAEINKVKSLTNISILQTMQALPTTGIVGEFLSQSYWHKKSQIEISSAIGFHIYPRFEQTIFKQFSHIFKARLFAWKYLGHMTKLVKKSQNELLCTELQAEPWEAGGFNLQDAYKHKTINPEMVINYLDRLRILGIEKVLLWGSEFHIASEKAGNPVWIENLYNHTTR